MVRSCNVSINGTEHMYSYGKIIKPENPYFKWIIAIQSMAIYTLGNLTSYLKFSTNNISQI